MPPVSTLISGLDWNTSVNEFMTTSPWNILNNGTVVRFNMEDSADCGGSNGNAQGGTATTTITVGGTDTLFDFSFAGMGENMMEK